MVPLLGCRDSKHTTTTTTVYKTIPRGIVTAPHPITQSAGGSKVQQRGSRGTSEVQQSYSRVTVEVQQRGSWPVCTTREAPVVPISRASANSSADTQSGTWKYFPLQVFFIIYCVVLSKSIPIANLYDMKALFIPIVDTNLHDTEAWEAMAMIDSAPIIFGLLLRTYCGEKMCWAIVIRESLFKTEG